MFGEEVKRVYLTHFEDTEDIFATGNAGITRRETAYRNTTKKNGHGQEPAEF